MTSRRLFFVVQRIVSRLLLVLRPFRRIQEGTMFTGSASRELQLKRLTIVPLDVVGRVSAQACHRTLQCSKFFSVIHYCRNMAQLFYRKRALLASIQRVPVYYNTNGHQSIIFECHLYFTDSRLLPIIVHKGYTQ